MTLAACGGGGQSSAAFLPAQQSSGTPAPTSTANGLVSSAENNQLVVSGTITSLMSNGFELQGGTGFGYYNIYTNSTTAFTGSKPYVGELVVVGGTGTVSTSLTATSVAEGKPLTISGPIVGFISGGFEIKGGPGVGSLNIHTNAGTTVTGAKPYVGEVIKAVGAGSTTTSLAAVSITEATAGGSTPTPVPIETAQPRTSPTAAPTAAPTSAPTNTPVTPVSQPGDTSFMPSSWGKIEAMQVFDETSNGYVTPGAASTDGGRYTAVWGARPNIAGDWLASNSSLQTSYYNTLETDESPTGWGAIGHTLSWWQSNHPDWVLYACTSSGSVSSNPAYVPGLNNVPLDIHNAAVVDYQIHMMANYAHAMGYHALAIDEATFWQADQGAGSGSYGCGIHQNGQFVRRYTGVMDPAWAADVVAWVKQAHSILTSDPTVSQYHLKLIVNHPANQLTANEQTFLANIDADLNEDGNTFFGGYVKGSASYFVRTTNWTTYAQKHGVAVLTDDNWGNVSVGTPQMDWSVATYLMSNEQAQALYVAQGNQFGTETWHSQYNTQVGAPCGEYYSANDSSNPSIYFRRFANAIVVVNGGSGSNSEVAHLPSGHTYSDLFGRPVSSTLTIGSNDGYVLMTSNGCN